MTVTGVLAFSGFFCITVAISFFLFKALAILIYMYIATVRIFARSYICPVGAAVCLQCLPTPADDAGSKLVPIITKTYRSLNAKSSVIIAFLFESASDFIFFQPPLALSGCLKAVVLSKVALTTSEGSVAK